MDCPHCDSAKTRRSPRRGPYEGLLLRLMHRAPWRCKVCGLRFLAASEAQGAPTRRRARSLLAYLGLSGTLEMQLSLALGLAAIVIAMILLGTGLELLEDIPVVSSAQLR